MHYVRERKRRLSEEDYRPCSVDGCDRPQHLRGLCSTHYSRLRRPGRAPDPSLPGEQWKPVRGFSGAYAVSNFGRVRRVGGDVRGAALGRVLTTFVSKQPGYPAVNLQVGGVKRVEYVHRLVAEAFLGPARDDAQVNHRDGDKLNNDPSNLEWVTPSENIDHSYRAGLKATKLTEGTVREIRQLHPRLSMRLLAQRFGVSKKTILDVLKRRTWKHVG